MEKQTPFNTANQYNKPPLGTGTTTSSGVTVFNPSASNTNPPLPPTYDQAMGNTAPFTRTAAGSYTTTNGRGAPGMGLPNATHTATTYTTYTTSVPPPRRPAQQATYVQHHPAPPPPPPPPHTLPAATPPVVIIQQTPMQPLGPERAYLTCPACHIQKLTRIEYEPSTRTHVMAVLLCLVGLWCCVCLPYCAGSCMNTHHYCGNCGKFLGTFDNTL